MNNGHYFRPLRDGQASHKPTVAPDEATLLELISSEIIKPLTNLGDGRSAVPLVVPVPRDTEDPPPKLCHPACAEHAGSDYCRESWLLHLGELKRRSDTHWHKCDQGRLCALVPVASHNRCWAAIQLVCPVSMPEADFERQVELLDMLVKGFVSFHADFFARLMQAEPPAARLDEPASPGMEQNAEQQLSHPLVLKAIEYIEAHLAEPKLTVSTIARELDVDFSYLGRLFADEVGQRMSWFIAARRVELAKTLLTMTDRQIKRISHETGHANPNWFCHVFVVHTGLTPRGYRKKMHHKRGAAGGRHR